MSLGELKQIDKIRGDNKLLKAMVDYLEEKGKNWEDQTIGISHADNPKLVKTFVKMAEKRLKTDNFKIAILGATMGTHSGPGTFAVFFFDEYAQ